MVEHRSSSRAPKPNTRFLKSLVRDVDGHNTALLREQANAARAAAADKFYQESNSRTERDGRREADRGSSSRSRNGEDSDVARMKRLFGGAVGSAASSRQSADRSRRDTGESSSPGHLSSHRDSRQSGSTSAGKSGGAAGSWRREGMGNSSSRYQYEDEASEDEKKGWSRKDVGRSKPRSALQRAKEEEEAVERKRAREEEDRKRDRERNRSPAPSAKRRDYDDVPGLRIPPPDMTSAVPSIPSKMDRYFEPTYDPKQDYRAMLDAQDVAVPRTGLVPDVDIGWDSMLSTLKYRGQAKERGRDHDREKERDRHAREWEKERERERERHAKAKSRDKTTTSDSKRRRDRSPSVISIPDSSEDSSSDNDSASDSWSESSDPDRRKRKHSHSKRSKGTSTREKEHRSKKDSSSSGRHKRSSKRRRQESDEERERKKVLVGGYEYVSKGATREWDRGK